MDSSHLTQQEEMKTRVYVYGVEKLNGYDAWALFKACALGDMPKVKALLAKDRRLVNAQHWYQFPICTSSAFCSNEALTQMRPKTALRTDAHSTRLAAEIILRSPNGCSSTAPIPTLEWIPASAV
jgi:hypothetical protein